MALSKTPCSIAVPLNEPLGAIATLGMTIWLDPGNEPAGEQVTPESTEMFTMLVPAGETNKDGVQARHSRCGREGPRRKGPECQRRQERGKGPDAEELVFLLRTNNCLINAIARQAGVVVSLAQLTLIRVGVGSIGEMLVANPKTVRIIMQVLGLNRGLVVAYKDRAKSKDKTEKVPSEAFGNQRDPVIVVHNGRDHFISFDEAALEQELDIKKNGQ